MTLLNSYIYPSIQFYISPPYPAAWPSIQAQQWGLEHTAEVKENQQLPFLTDSVFEPKLHFQSIVWGINRTSWDVDHQFGEGFFIDSL